jgi:hypothetical protein
VVDHPPISIIKEEEEKYYDLLLNTGKPKGLQWLTDNSTQQLQLLLMVLPPDKQE